MFRKVVLFFFVFWSTVTLAVIPSIKVRIAKHLTAVSIRGTDLKNDLLYQGKEKVYSGKTTVNFNCLPKKQSKIDSHTPVLFASLSSATGIMAWKDGHYQGDLMVVTSKEQESCDLINRVPLETYIRTLLTKEMNGAWPIEALKAQAVAARSYALHKMASNEVTKLMGHESYYDVENSEKHQVTGTFFDTSKNSENASKVTEGEVLVGESGKVAPIFFHSKCGGLTLRPDQAWENKVEGYESVACPYCKKHGVKPWNFVMERQAFQKMLFKFLKKEQGREAKIQVVPDAQEKLALRFYIDEMLLKVNKLKFRKFMGRESLPSNLFQIKLDGNHVVFSGEGNGHGVGLCQFGALELADRGWDYKKILSFYFPNHKLKKIY
ncbi:MAG: SpoIID/LytB domain-containing protein [Bacteriovoracaceae bacterium]